MPLPPRPTRRTLLAVLSLLAVACAGGGATGPQVPDLDYETFDGGRASLADLAGEPAVVNFWASWCPPCVAEMPDFERVHLDVADEVRFVGINTQDQLPEAQRLVEETGVTYDLGLDPDGELFREFGVVSMPSTFFVTAEGTIAHRHAGLLTEAQLRELIDEHLR